MSIKKPNILLGAVSGNYTTFDVRNWVESAKNVLSIDDRISLLVYNAQDNRDLISYLHGEGVEVYEPMFDLWGQRIGRFETNTGTLTQENGYKLIHNIRFLHFWHLLSQIQYNQVLITDVKDVIINKNPFNKYDDRDDFVIASSEEILYCDHEWNRVHIEQTFGLVSLNLLDKPVYNVGVVLGKGQILLNLCIDIYLNAINKHKVADQTAFNYLIQHSYKKHTVFTDLQDKWAVHLHVINEGKVAFDLNTLKDYVIIHQYDRLKDEILNYYTLPQ